MQGKAVMGLIVVLSLYALYDYFSAKKYQWISLESKFGMSFFSNILSMIGLMNIFYLYNVKLHFTIYIGLMLLLTLIVQVLSIYFTGFRYKVPYDDTGELSVMLKNVLWHQGYKDVEQVVEYRENKFSFPGEKKRIELEFREGIVTRRDFHYLKFKKWGNSESREAITEALDEKLERYDPQMPSSIFRVLEFLLILAFMIGFIGYFNYLAINPSEVEARDHRLPIETLMLSDLNRTITDPSALLLFEEQLNNAEGHTNKYLTFDKFGDQTIQVFYGNPYKSLFVGPEFSYLYIDYAKLKESSIWDRFMVSMYELYGRQSGAYYIVDVDSEILYEKLMEVIEEGGS